MNIKRGCNMALLNKQTSTEEKIGSTLRKNIRTSKDFDFKMIDSREVYYLDGMDISFDVCTNNLDATYKSGSRFVSMCCAYNPESSVQKARFNMFSSVLEAARKRESKEKAKKAKRKAQEQMAQAVFKEQKELKK